MNFSIASVSFELSTKDKTYRDIVSKYLKHCLIGGVCNNKVDWQIEVVPYRKINNGEKVVAGITEIGDRFLLSAEGGVQAFVSKDLKQVKMELADYNFEYGEFTCWIALASMLRIYLSLALPQTNTLMFHGSSLADGNHGRLFLGPSGAGKSTVCSLGQGRAVFNDEASFIKKEEDGWKVYHSPFFSNNKWPKHQVETLPLGGIYLLQQDTKDFLEPMSTVESVAEVMSCIMNFRNDPGTASKLLDLTCDLLIAHPPFRMHFSKSERFWKLIADHNTIS